jgi:hypothetical protein
MQVCPFAAMHFEILLLAFCDDFEEQIDMRLSGLAVILSTAAAVV